jgi:hypothetical protein
MGSTDAWFVMSCGSDIGNAGAYIQPLCEEKGLRYRGVLEVVMPENYIAMFEVPGQAEAAEVVLQAAEAVAQAAPAAEAVAAPKSVGDLMVIVNGRPVTLKGKAQYCFVDILDFYPFDVSQAHGQNVVMRINGEGAEFTSPLSAGDVIDLYWN